MMTRGETGNSLLDFEPYVPFVKLFGTSKEPFEVGGRPILGLTRDEVKAARARWRDDRPSYGDDHISLQPPRTEFGSTFMSVFFGEEGEATSFSLSIDYGGHPPFRAEVLAVVKGRLGEPKMDKDYGGRERMSWGTDPKIELVDDGERKFWSFSVERPAR